MPAASVRRVDGSGTELGGWLEVGTRKNVSGPPDALLQTAWNRTLSPAGKPVKLTVFNV